MNSELERMKAEMNLLKKKLEKQEIVNEQHLRKAIKGKLDEINRTAVVLIFLGFFALVCNIAMQRAYGYSIYLQAGTSAMLIFSIAATYVQHKNLLKAKDLSADLVKETFDLVKLKRRYNRWLWYEVPIIVVWLSMMLYETLYVIPMQEPLGTSMAIGLVIGVLIGEILGLRIHFKTLRKVDEMLSQIEAINSGA